MSIIGKFLIKKSANLYLPDTSFSTFQINQKAKKMTW